MPPVPWEWVLHPRKNKKQDPIFELTAKKREVWKRLECQPFQRGERKIFYSRRRSLLQIWQITCHYSVPRAAFDRVYAGHNTVIDCVLNRPGAD